MKSIRFKLWAGMMALVAVVLVLLWLSQVVFLERFYTAMHLADIEGKTAELVRLLEQGDTQGFSEGMETLAFSNNLSAEVVDAQGRQLYVTESTDSGGHGRMMMNAGRGDVLRQALAGAPARASLTHPRFGNQMLLMGLPITEDGTVTAALLITVPLAPVEETAAILKRQLVVITAILVLAALGISFFLARGFSRPVLAIKETAQRLADGDYAARTRAHGQDEIGLLAETINALGAQLSRTEQLRKDLIANVSHELRTPLSLIRGYAETIRDVSGDSRDKRNRQLGIIIEESERLGSIVDDILNLSQLQAGVIALEPVEFDLAERVHKVAGRYRVLSEKTGIRIAVTVAGSALAQGDTGRIEQVLHNLVNNAFNHTPEGGLVQLRVIPVAESVRVEVADTGPGIPEEEAAAIWSRYYMADKTEARHTVGTGLGLAIVREILVAHEAPYGVESTLGQGSTFWFQLKRAGE